MKNSDLDRFHLVIDVIDRVATLGSRGAHTKQLLREKLLDHRAYIQKHGQDMPEIRDWEWQTESEKPTSQHSYVG